MAAIGIIVSFVVTFLLYKVYKWIYSDVYLTCRPIPGPPALPLIGNLHQLVGLSQTEFFNQFHSWIEEYGSPMKLMFGPGDVQIGITKADHMETILKSTTNITKGKSYKVASEWLGNGLLMSDGEKWFTRRKQLTPAFHFQILKDFNNVFNEQAAILVDILKETCQGGQEQINLVKPISSCTLDIICETAMGVTMGAQQGNIDYTTSLARFADITTKRFRSIYLRPNIIFNLTKASKDRDYHLNKLHGFTMKVINERLAAYKQQKAVAKTMTFEQAENDVFSFGSKGKQRKAFLDLLLELQDQGLMNLQNIREEVDTFMFEGHDTTAFGIIYALWCIGSHKDVQDKLYDEIYSVFGSDKNVPVKPEDLSQMQYLERVLKESQRLLPSVPQVARTLTEDIKFGKYTIPKGAGLFINFYGLHHDPDQFPDPLTYDPDRFLPENVEGRHPFAFVPFSAGSRNCIGQRFALTEEKVLLIHILRNFTVEETQKFEELATTQEFILRPSGGLWVKLTPR